MDKRDCELESRVKIVTLDQQLMIDTLNWWRTPRQAIALPIAPDIPEDAVVLHVSANWERRCLEALIASPQFDRVPDGELPQRLSGVVKQFRIVQMTDITTTSPLTPPIVVR